MMNNRLILSFLIIIELLSCKIKEENVVLSNTYKVEDLYLAIDSDNSKDINKIIASGININRELTNDEKSFLDYAISKGNQNAAVILIKNGAELNKKDNNGYTSFSKAVGKLSPVLISEFLSNGLNYKDHTFRNMNYFEYMLYKKDYLSALEFLKHREVYNYFKDNRSLFLYLIYYWNDRWSPIIGNYLINNGYSFDETIPYYFFAIDEHSKEAVVWLDSIGISSTNKYLDDNTGLFFTPIEYANNKLSELQMYLGKDYLGSEEDIKEVNKIVQYLELIRN